MSLDPDDPRPPYRQVANQLRAAIATGKLAAGEKLPSHAELCDQYGVARMTVQQALRVLKDEGLVISRQGSGVFVRHRTAKPVGLQPHIAAAFEASEVQIDFFGLSAETLHGMVQSQLDRLREGTATPDTVRLRLIIADFDGELVVPAPARGAKVDAAAVRARLSKISTRHIEGLHDEISELARLGLIKSGTVEVRCLANAPMFKCYIVNNSEVFCGYYPVVQHKVPVGKGQHEIYDLMGKDSVMFHHAAEADPDHLSSQFVSQTTAWFESVWGTIARPVEGFE